MRGKFITLEEGENPSFRTQDEELVVLEVRYDPTGKVVPPTLAVMLPVEVDARAPTRATTYDSI